jgi:hypothetical protein
MSQLSVAGGYSQKQWRKEYDLAIGKFFEMDRGFSQCRVLCRVSGSVVMHLGHCQHTVAALAPYKFPSANIVNIKALKSSRDVIPRSVSSAQLYSKCSQLRSLIVEMVRQSSHHALFWGRSHLPRFQGILPARRRLCSGEYGASY